MEIEVSGFAKPRRTLLQSLQTSAIRERITNGGSSQASEDAESIPQVQQAIFDSLNIKVQDSDLDIDSVMQFNQFPEPPRDQGTLQGTINGTVRTSPLIPSGKRGPGYDPPLSPVGITASQFNIQIRKSKSNLRDSP